MVTKPGKESAVLVEPECFADAIFTLYHESLLSGHRGITETYPTLSHRFFIPNLIHNLRAFIGGCHLCQISRNAKPPERPF